MIVHTTHSENLCGENLGCHGHDRSVLLGRGAGTLARLLGESCNQKIEGPRGEKLLRNRE